MAGGRCSRCRSAKKLGYHAYCRACRNAYMRATRPAYCELSAEDRRKSIVRSIANVAVSRGKLKRQPCRRCGARRAEKHHPDYSKPLKVSWLCRGCHRTEHRIRASL